jgi:hypothetical protein
MLERIVGLMAAGEITIDEASRMARLIELRRGHGGLGARARARDATPAAPTCASPSPASSLQTAGDVVRPLNRHERRRAAAIMAAGLRDVTREGSVDRAR